ncbi:MAG: hypothetical protein CL666_05875 [Balneola sp.]|nr:hypothetical protein [Balneola sp.]|tara:strand:+ start:148392 stop:149525 length:1134 start_codon:yes stop_codon:yes gene_type:complete
MGRAMLIISAGAVITLGIIQVGIQGQRAGITENNAVSAYEVEIRNKAFTASQITMERINESGGSWKPTKANPWKENIDGDSISLYYELISTTTSGSFSLLEGDTVQIFANSWYRNPRTNQREEIDIKTSYVKTAMHFVPEFESAMSFAVDEHDFDFAASGNVLINGNDASGTCPSKPAVTVRDDGSANKITGADNLTEWLSGGDNSEHFESDSGAVSVDPDISYEPVDQLVARLSQMSGVKKISGNYKGDFGSPEDPGVFFVEDYAKLTGGISEGYGIMVVRTNGELEYEGELSVAGNFKFNGLVIFENAYAMTGRGTPRINGSVLVGKTDDNYTDFDIDLGGTLDIQYDCTAEKYAQLASASLLQQNRYKRLSTFE